MNREFAPAKINLCLHVTGQRADGYHLLDSLVLHVDVGDFISGVFHDALSLELMGPTAAGVPRDKDNLVLRAARLLSTKHGAELTLEKHLPSAAGIGGGSSDAAATVRLCARLWGLPVPALEDLAKLGADVPVCREHDLTRMRGMGEHLDRLGPPPEFYLVLVNPRVSVATPDVFRALESKTNSELRGHLPVGADSGGWVKWLADQRNDLERPARKICPVIDEVLEALSATQEAMLVRMSGSGATCFALYPNRAAADAASKLISEAHMEWWVRPCQSYFSQH